MTSDLLKAFLAVAETGNFTLAGQRVLRTQGAVSQMMKRLETELGCTLIDRGKTPVQLTENGKRLLPHARTILAAEAEALAAFDRSDLSGPVALGMPEIYADIFISRILPGFQERFPKVKVNLLLQDTVDLVTDLKSGALDLTFATEGEVEGLSGPVVYSASVAWLAPLGRNLETLDPLPLVAWKKGSNYEKTVVDALENAGHRVSVVVNTQTIHGMNASVRAGLGIAATALGLPHEGVRILSEGTLPAIAPRKVRLVRAEGDRRAAVDELAAHIQQALAENGE